MSDNEVEEVSFLPGETILNKKAVYEPSSSQRCRQLVCSRSWAITILILMGLFLVLIAIIASFARPQSLPCSPINTATSPPSTEKPPPPKYIATNGKEFPWKNVRLPKSILPTNYHIFMHPNISESFFKGKVTIDAKVSHSTDFIVFHIKDLNITHFSILSKREKQVIPYSDSLEYKENQQFYIQLERKLTPGEEITLEVKFEGQLIKKLAGFYKSTYKTLSGEKREIATTHFEPTDARAAFPCFDEPEMKANFSMSIVRESHRLSLFNMPLERTDTYEKALLLDQFQTSVTMSTYLVAFVVCDYGVLHKTTSQGTKVSVYAPKEQIDQAKFALDAAVKVLEYYNKFFGVPYPLPKQDLIAIPDFAAGAMENWGLITYRMTAILYDPAVSSPAAKQWVAVVVAHELAHQWFGNLVTMKWWDDLWLNEGFASFVEYIGADIVNKDFNMHDQFVNELIAAMYLDSFSNSHPIHVPVHNPDEINEIFDKISYSKGSSVLSMLRNFLGQDNFQRGLTGYLNKHKFSNAETDDLWAALQDASSEHLDVKAVMDTWTKQMGYPVVTVKKNTKSNSLSLTQDRFLLNPGVVDDGGFKSPFGYKWRIPFTFTTSKDLKSSTLVWMNMSSVSISYPEGADWIKGNKEMSGFYRVNYEKSMWEGIIKQLKTNHEVFSAADRANLIDDAFSLALAGRLSQTIALELTLYLDKETEYIPWNVALANLDYIRWRIQNKDIYENFQKYLLKLLNPLINSLGWEDSDSESHLHRLLRSKVLKWALILGHEGAEEKGKKLFHDWMNNTESINPNLKGVIYKAGIENGKDTEWKFCWNQYVKTNVPSEKIQMLTAMSRTKNSRRLEQYLNYCLNQSKIRSQDLEIVVTAVALNPGGQLLAWRFLEGNWDAIQKRYSSGSFTLSKLIKGTTANFNTVFDYNEVKRFFADKDVGSGTRAVKQSLEKIQMNIDWLKHHEKEVTDWLKQNGS